jgi:hypothetical protein
LFNIIAATDLIRHLSNDAIVVALKFININEISKKCNRININVKTQQDELCESVSDITGVV